MLPALLILLFLFLPSPALAGTIKETGAAPVTLTVPATAAAAASDAPGPPILISPGNNSIINSSSPTFIFEPPAETANLHKYEIWLDGSFDHELLHATGLTLSTTATSALSDGQHTWKVKAVNNSGLGTDSATFSFTVDTSPPVILITRIAEHSVSLSSQDPSTIPAGYSISVKNQTPTIAGSSEAYADLTISLTGAVASYTFSVTVAPDTSFTYTPDFKLASDTYTVSISGSDQASNSTSLPSFSLTITPPVAKTLSITIPLPPPLKDLKLPGPPIPQLKLPTLPESLTAFPLNTASASILPFLPWLIILLLLLYIFIPKPIILYLNLATLIYLFLATLHWLPLLIALSLVGLIIYLKKTSP